MGYKPKKIISKEDYANKIKRVGDLNRLKAKEEAEKQKKIALNSTRYIDDDLYIPELGSLKIRILYYPSFEQSFIWDIRKIQDKEFRIYENELLDSQNFKPGYKQLMIDETELNELFEELSSLIIRVIDNEEMIGLDGITYGIQIIQSSGFRKIKLIWWEEPQSELRKLDLIIKRLIRKFIECKKENVA